MRQIKNLKDLFQQFSDEQKCIEFLVQMRWDGSPVCPYCNSNKWYSIEKGKRFKCGDKTCYKKYSATTGTIFHASNIPLSTWFPAVYLISAHKKGISSVQLSKDLGVTQKTGWFMLHRIREALKNNSSVLLKNVVEIDEVYAGGKAKNMSKKKRAEFKENAIGTQDRKTMIIGMIERGGELRFEVAGNATEKRNISPIIHKNVDKSAFLMTDGEGVYRSIGKTYAGHESVNHMGNEYVRDGIIHTNTIEGAFGLFRRTIIGVYHKISPKHIERYCNEIQYRYNTREVKDGDRFENVLGKIEKRLSWKELTKQNGLTAQAIIEPAVPLLQINKQGRTRPVAQILNGETVAVFQSIKQASKATGILPTLISRVVRGLKKTTGGYEWKYV